MQQLQIVSGFSDLKRQFILKTGSGKAFAELQLYFTLEHDFLLVHDIDDHKSLMTVALYKPEARQWRIFVEDPSLAMNLLVYLTQGRNVTEALKFVEDNYLSYGFI